MRALLGGALVVHGVAHLVGFVVPWRIVSSGEVPYRTTLLGVDIGQAGVRAVGLAWLVVAVLFVVLGGGRPQAGGVAVRGHCRARRGLGRSLRAGLPESRPGLLANASIGALLLLGWFLGTYPEM